MRVLLSDKDLYSIIDEGKCCEEFLTEQYPDRPVMRVIYTPNNGRSSFEIFVYLRTEIHEWLLFNNALDYYFEVEGADAIEWGVYMNWYINIPDNDTALLFKLTWL